MKDSIHTQESDIVQMAVLAENYNFDDITVTMAMDGKVLVSIF